MDVEFRGENLLTLRRAVDVEAEVSARNGQIRFLSHFPGARHEPGPEGLWRVTFDVVPDGHDPVDVRVVLRQGGRAISETWTGLIFPQATEEPNSVTAA